VGWPHSMLPTRLRARPPMGRSRAPPTYREACGGATKFIDSVWSGFETMNSLCRHLHAKQVLMLEDPRGPSPNSSHIIKTEGQLVSSESEATTGTRPAFHGRLEARDGSTGPVGGGSRCGRRGRRRGTPPPEFVRHSRTLSRRDAHSRVVCEAWSGPLFAYHRMASVRPPREPAAYDDDASMQAPDVTYLQRVAAAQWSAAQHGCSAVLR